MTASKRFRGMTTALLYATVTLLMVIGGCSDDDPVGGPGLTPGSPEQGVYSLNMTASTCTGTPLFTDSELDTICEADIGDTLSISDIPCDIDLTDNTFSANCVVDPFDWGNGCVTRTTIALSGRSYTTQFTITGRLTNENPRGCVVAIPDCVDLNMTGTRQGPAPDGACAPPPAFAPAANAADLTPVLRVLSRAVHRRMAGRDH